MAERIVKDYDARKHEILEKSQELFFSKGFEQTSVNDILQAVGIAKGTFYYYFKSKEELLESLLTGMSRHILMELEPILEDPDLKTMDKLRRMVGVAQRIKSANRRLIKTYLTVIYKDENLRLLHKANQYVLEAILPVYEKLIMQGAVEEVFSTPWPRDTAELFIRLVIGMRDAISTMLIEMDGSRENIDLLHNKIDVYEDAMERILGAEKGSLKLIHREYLEAYLEDIN